MDININTDYDYPNVVCFGASHPEDISQDVVSGIGYIHVPIEGQNITWRPIYIENNGLMLQDKVYDYLMTVTKECRAYCPVKVMVVGHYEKYYSILHNEFKCHIKWYDAKYNVGNRPINKFKKGDLRPFKNK